MDKRILLCLVPVCALFTQAKDIASYSITARLLPEAKSVRGRELLTWLNDSGDPIGELRFHLYMNAFKNSRSTFMRESGGQLRGDRASKKNWGWIQVKRMQIAGGDDLTKSIQFIHPDDDNADDRTVIRVPLPEPLKPGKSIQLDIEFETKFPEVFARTGYHGDFYLGGQWFPKIGVYERIGTRYAQENGAWNCHQFHANSEFYADFGKYDVDLTVPAGYVVGATGVERRRQENNDRTVTYGYSQDNVHDFAWTAQPGYIKIDRVFVADTEVKPAELTEAARLFGASHEEVRLSDVKMTLLLQPEHRGQTERHFKAVSAAIKYFGLWYGRYPHQTITVVDPPYGAGGAGGMEYPTFITAGTGWLIGDNDGEPEDVTVHEFGHQFWQGLVASNEFEEAWMDEGFNTYSTGKVLDKVYGRRGLPFNLFGIPVSWFMSTLTVDSLSTDRAGYLAAPRADNLARSAWGYRNSTSYGLNSYMRPAVVLTTLERFLGADNMARAMRLYQQRWRYGHPAAPDFIKTVEEVSGKNLKWFFDQYVYGSNLVDYAIDELKCEPERTGVGVFEEGNGLKTVTADDAEKIDKKAEKDHKELFRTRLTVARNGEATFPVDIVVRFENGETERRQWDGEYRWVRYEFVKNSKAVSAVVDPDRKIALDANRSNNSYILKSNARETVKLASTLLLWVQNLLTLISAVA